MLKSRMVNRAFTMGSFSLWKKNLLNYFLVAIYTGSRCEVDEDNCEGSIKCYNGGMCKDENLDFKCLCRTTDVYTSKWFVFCALLIV